MFGTPDSHGRRRGKGTDSHEKRKYGKKGTRGKEEEIRKKKLNAGEDIENE